jgi:photosystem II stability/assembly factor-like uncharacterized protein
MVRPGAATALALIVLLWSRVASAHDASAWGGLFVSRDHGATWFLASPGTYPTAAIAIAVSPTDGNHLLLATDTGLLRSRNGGRDWTREASSALSGAVFAAAFAGDGKRAMVSTASGIFRSDAGDDWRPTQGPDGLAPARVIVRGVAPSRAYVAGWTGFARTDDWGASWSTAPDGLPSAPVTSMLVIAGPPETVHVVAGDQLWSIREGEPRWVARPAGTPGVEALGGDPGLGRRLWAARGNRLLQSADEGATWRPVGGPLPESNTAVRGIAAAGDDVVVTTDRGIFRTRDGGQRWVPLVDNLPAHLEAGPLVRDPSEPTRLYAGFSVTPYGELWRRAVDSTGTWRRIDPTSLLGAAALLTLLAIGSSAALRRLGRHYRAAPRR